MKTFQTTLNAFTTALLLCFVAFNGHSIKATTYADSPIEILESCPTASFSIANNNVLAGTPVSFTNQSSGAGSYVWDFGDGTFSIDANPTHVYSTAGTYTVKLRAFGGGCTVEFIGTEDVMVL